MKAIILAAGRGSRLEEHTQSKPKCFTQVNKKRIIDYIIKTFDFEDINEISIVTGYKKELFDFDVKYFLNRKWEETNMVYSLLQAKKLLLTEDCIVSYSDIIYDKKIISEMIKKNSDFLLVSNLNWKKNWQNRYENPLDDLETFKIRNNQLIEIGEKPKNYNEIDGQYMGLLKFTPKLFKKILEILEELPKNEVYKMDMTTLLNLLIKNNIKIDILNTNKFWYEIDNKKDLEFAQHNLKESFLNKSI